MNEEVEEATFAAGCFWGVEETFRHVPGVVNTEVGYSGGHTKDPTYKEVCAGDTGHAEAVRVHFDPKRISYEELLKIFWEVHDPTQVGGQGLDLGEQYRSMIFYHNDRQRKAAEHSREKLVQSGSYDHGITTEIIPASDFYRAQEYHQCYIAKQKGIQGK